MYTHLNLKHLGQQQLSGLIFSCAGDILTGLEPQIITKSNMHH